jgi:hypothetical protein
MEQIIKIPGCLKLRARLAYLLYLLSAGVSERSVRMKTGEFKLPLEASREVAMAIIDQLPPGEFSKVVEDIRIRTRNRALLSARKLRSAVHKSGLRRRDFDKAFEEVRAEKAKKTNRRS